MVEAAPEQPPPTSTNLHQPSPTSPLRDQTLQRIARPFRPAVSPLERRDVQWDRRQVVEQDRPWRSEEHTSELQSLAYLVCRLLLEKKKNKNKAFCHRQRIL